jgi:NAD(P)-dependent dehydrogenase (short-subunit alcohol dehydrogenase family)
MLSLKNKVAIITGGGSGIGKATALLFAKQGATVHIIDLNKIEAEATEKEINGNAIIHECNVTEHQKVKEVITSIGSIDILVNSAGISHIGNAENTTEEDFDRLYNVNVKGVYNCINAALPGMKSNGHGVILNLASVAGLMGLPDRFAYSATKGAVYAMTLSVARDFISYGIRCNCISPARVHTPFVDGFIKKNYPGREKEMFEKLSATQPIGRMGRPEEIAMLILYLCSDEAAFITGCDYPIDGGAIKLNN